MSLENFSCNIFIFNLKHNKMKMLSYFKMFSIDVVDNRDLKKHVAKLLVIKCIIKVLFYNNRFLIMDVTMLHRYTVWYNSSLIKI